MKIEHIINETTTAGAVSSVAMPLGKTQRRTTENVKGLIPAEKVLKAKKKGPYANSLSEGKEKKPVIEADLQEDDLIIIPGQSKRLKAGFIPKAQDRTDHEVEMAKADLLALYKNTKSVLMCIKDISEDEGLEGWVQEKIIKASDYMNTLAEYFEGKKIQEMTGGVIAAGGVGEGVAEGKVINTYLWHGSRQKISMLEPRQAVDTGGAAGSNQNAIYATSDPKVAIAMGLTTPGSDTAMFPNDPQMVLFSGKIRKGEYVYLHKLPFKGPDGKPQFVQGGHSREFHSIPGVEGIKPIEIKEIPVNKYLNLIRKATPADLKLRKKYMKKQSVAEGLNEITWIKPNFDYEWDEIEFQAKQPQVPADVRNYMAKHFPNKQAWMKSVQHGHPVVVSPDHGQKIRNYTDNKRDLLNALSPQSHDPQGPAKAKRVNALFDKGGPIEMPIILKTNKGLWLIGGKTRLGTANLLKGIPAKVWMIGGEQGVAEGIRDDAMAGLQRTIDFAKQHGYKIYRSPTGRKMRFVNKELEHEIRAQVDNYDDSINVNFMDYYTGTSGNDDASYFDQVFKDAYEQALWDYQNRKSDDENDDGPYTLSQLKMLQKQGVAEGTLTEKAKSTAQQKFFGMAHAMQKGKKIPGASKELKDVAKSMSKSDVKDFAKTKHKGLPTHVKKEK